MTIAPGEVQHRPETTDIVGVDTDYERDMYSLLPSIAALVSIQEVGEQNLRDSAEALNESAGQQILQISNKRASPIWENIVSVSRQMCFSAETRQDFINALTEAKEREMDELEKTLTHKSRLSDEQKVLMNETTIKDADFLFAEREATETLQTEYHELSVPQRERVIKLLFTPLSEGDTGDAKVKTALLRALAAPYKNERPIVESLIESVQAGEFDYLIYELAVTNEVIASRAQALRAMTGLVVKVTAQLSPELPYEKVIREISKNSTHFTNGSDIEMRQLRQDILRNLTYALTAARTIDGIPSQRKDIEVLKTKLAILLEEFTYSFSKGHILPIDREVISRKRIHNKKRLQELDEGRGRQENTEFQPRTVRLAHTTVAGFESACDTDDEGNSNLDSMINSYVSKHLGTRMLYEDIKGAIEFIRNIDFASGLVRGVQKHGETRIDGKQAVLYGLKPMDAQGVLKRSKVMNQTRLYFLIDGDEVAYITRILDRDEANAYMIALGIGSKRNRG